jgi:competence protein ComEC
MPNEFDRYRKAKKHHGGRTDVSSDWIGWSIIGTIATLAVVSWVFAVPGYRQLLTRGQAQTTSTSETANVSETSGQEKALPGLLLTERKPDETAIVFLDVGQGDAIFIKTPDDQHMLIDSGEGENPDYKFARKVDAANELILPFFHKNNIDKLDYYIASHPHSDHIGSAADIFDEMPVEEVWISGKKHASTSKERMLKSIDEHDITMKAPAKVGGTLKEGQTIDMGSAMKGWLLRTAPKDDDINNASLGILLYYGDVGMIFAGDTEGSKEGGGLGEQELVRTWGNQLDVEILKSNHHGSRFSTSQTFVDFVEPDHTVFMVGHYNTFGHPTPEAISRAEEVGSEIHRTDQEGTIYMFTDGENIRVMKRRDFSAVSDS